MRELSELIRSALQELDPYKVAARVYVDDAPSMHERVEVFHRWAQGDGRPDDRQLRDFIVALRARASNLAEIADEIQAIARADGAAAAAGGTGR